METKERQSAMLRMRLEQSTAGAGASFAAERGEKCSARNEREKMARKRLVVAMTAKREKLGKGKGKLGDGEVGKGGVGIEVGESHLNKQIF